MPGRQEIESSENSRRQLQGLPLMRRNVAGIDLGILPQGANLDDRWGAKLEYRNHRALFVLLVGIFHGQTGSNRVIDIVDGTISSPSG
jgi:hypothetical protein